MKNLLLVIAFMAISISTIAQTEKTDRVETKDGSVYNGIIVFENELTLKLKINALDTVTIDKKEITDRKTEDRSDPIASRYFWTPSAYSLSKGEVNYQNIMLFVNHVSVGVTDNFSIGAGLVPMFIAGGGPTPFWITPKYSFPVAGSKFRMSIGGLFGTVGRRANQYSFGLISGAATFGSPNSNLTVGLGWGFVDRGVSTGPSFNISATQRITNRLYALGEFYSIADSDGDRSSFGNIGVRLYLGRVGLDLGAMVIEETYFFPRAIPFAGLSIPLTKK